MTQVNTSTPTNANSFYQD